MLAKTAGAILVGVVNALVPILMAAALTDLTGVRWWAVLLSVLLITVSSTFLGLFIAVSVSEVFEAQAFSNFFRFPMVFLCGLFIPIAQLPPVLRPLSYLLPLTYGGDVLQGAMVGRNTMPWPSISCCSSCSVRRCSRSAWPTSGAAGSSEPNPRSRNRQVVMTAGGHHDR